MIPSRGLGLAWLMLTLTLAPVAGCGDDLPDLVLDGGSSASTSQGTTAGTGPVTTMVTSADTTVGSMSDSMGSTTSTSSSSGDPGSTSGTTQGVSATMGSTGDDTTSGSTSDATTSGATGGMTSGATGGMTSGATSGMTSGATSGMTSVATDFSASTSGDLGGTTDLGTTSGTTGGTTDMTGGATDDGATGGMTEVPDFTGDFLFVVATPLDPTLPFQYVANFDYVPSGMGGGTVDVELQPLALDTGSTTTPRTFFGPPLVFPALPVTPDGTFAIPVGILNVAAETNPLFLIDAQANNVIFSVQVLDTDNLCGTVTGFLVFPVASPLDGTTIGAVRVADIMPPGLPLVFPVACP